MHPSYGRWNYCGCGCGKRIGSREVVIRQIVSLMDMYCTVVKTTLAVLAMGMVRERHGPSIMPTGITLADPLRNTDDLFLSARLSHLTPYKEGKVWGPGMTHRQSRKGRINQLT
jgi:hypothetical protein